MGRTTDASILSNLFNIIYLLIYPCGFPVLYRSRSRGVKVPANDSGERVNLSGYLDAGHRALPGLARNAPGSIAPRTPVGIGEEQVSVLIAPAGGAAHGPVAFGRGNNFIQPEETHQEDSHGGNGNQKVRPAGLQNGILHLRLQNAAVQRC